MILYKAKYSHNGKVVSTGIANLAEIMGIISRVKNGNNFLLFEYRELPEESLGINPAVTNVVEHLIDGLYGTKESVINYLNITKSKNTSDNQIQN